MKQESGKGMIKAFILLVIMILIIVGICMSISKNIKTQKIDTVVSDMLTIKAKCKVFNENRIRTNKNEDELIGTKLSDIGEESELKSIIEDFKKVEVVTEEEYAKYYVLTDKNLEDLKINVTNEKNSYYLINYETNEVIITKGYEGKYKISEIEKVVEETENRNNESKDTENKDNGE